VWVLLGCALICRPVLAGPPDSAAVLPGDLAQAVNSPAPAGIVLPEPSAPGLPETSALVIRAILSLCVVIFLIWGAVQVARRLSGERALGGVASHVAVLDRAYLAPKKAVYILRIGSRALAVGVTDSHMSLLTELDLPETLAAYPSETGRKPAEAFAAVLRNVRARLPGSPPDEGGSR
jgi:flagellar biogenesis protein FliO